MAVTLKRKRGAVSYKEPSSDDDESGDSESGPGRRRRTTAPARRSNRQRDLHNDGDGDDATPATTAKPTASDTRAARGRARRKVSYKDVSTDEDEEDPDADFQVSDEEPRRAKPSRSANASPRGQTVKRATKGKSPRKKLFGAPLKPNIPHQHAEKPAVPSDGFVPAWPRLPYHVLLQVFAYASHPLRDENMKPMPSISWLVQAARTCTAFTKPALTALYRNPPIFAMRSTRKDLVHQLISPPPGAHEDHRVMVKRLELDATQMTALTDHVHSAADLGSLIRALTTLREIDIFDPLDRPPFRGRLRRIRRWVYPPELFDALRHSDIRLQSWRWNSIFCDQGPLWMKTVHGDAAFQSLRELTLTKFHPPEVIDAPTEEGAPLQPTTEELVGSALTALPNLKALSFETCGIVGGRLLPLLPTNLISLSITNCGELLSDALGAFLVTHGANLKDLTLNYNQSLDLSFLVDLKQCCPMLESLRTDMTYYSSLTMSSDNDPLYETLLGENELPTWPTTLRTIDMQFLRNWNLTSATNFLSSLTESAGDLPWLREITIIASVDADWRERADFRQKWTAKFKRIFARKWESPSAHLLSLKAYREWTASSSQQKLAIHHKALAAAASHDHIIEATNAEDDSDAPLVSSKRDEKWGSKRLRIRSRATASYDEGTDSEGDPSDHDISNDDGHEEEEVVVQGRCHTVLFRIDNIRPQEEHFTEADFLDAEPSDDEEWNGNDDNDEGGYAW